MSAFSRELWAKDATHRDHNLLNNLSRNEQKSSHTNNALFKRFHHILRQQGQPLLNFKRVINPSGLYWLHSANNRVIEFIAVSSVCNKVPGDIVTLFAVVATVVTH